MVGKKYMPSKPDNLSLVSGTLTAGWIWYIQLRFQGCYNEMGGGDQGTNGKFQGQLAWNNTASSRDESDFAPVRWKANWTPGSSSMIAT